MVFGDALSPYVNAAVLGIDGVGALVGVSGGALMNKMDNPVIRIGVLVIVWCAAIAIAVYWLAGQ